MLFCRELIMKYIKQIILTIVLFLNLVASTATATIIYSGKQDIKGPNFNIDINADGSYDLTSQWRTWGMGNGFSQDGFDINLNFDMKFIHSSLPDPFFGLPGTKAPLDYGELIGTTPPQTLQWSNFSNDAMMWNTYDMWNNPVMTYGGVWHNLNDKYLGFELGVGLDNFYGWMQFNTDAFNNIILVDYAYENVPGASIMAGAVSVPVPEPSTFYLLFFGFLVMFLQTRKHTRPK